MKDYFIEIKLDLQGRARARARVTIDISRCIVCIELQADYRWTRINALPGCTIIISALAVIIAGMAINSCRSSN